MLKLEKTSDLSGLTICIREREGFLEPRLLKALAIALILHCGVLLLFQVTPFYFSSTFTFPPIQVQSDLLIPEASAVVSIDDEENDILPPPLRLIPDLDWLSLPQESVLSPSLTFDPYAFQQLEDKIWPKWQEPLEIKLEEPRIQLAISGDIAELSLLATDSLLNEMQSISVETFPVYATYQVQLDERTGEIFWYERTESSTRQDIDQLTEKILLNLRFASSKIKESVKGTLHFVVLIPKEQIG